MQRNPSSSNHTLLAKRFWWFPSSWRALAVALLIGAQPRMISAQTSPLPPRVTTGLLNSSDQLPTVGVWITNSPSPLYYSRTLMRNAVNDLDAAGFTALYLNVWSRGATFHRSNYAPVEVPLQKAGLGIDPICTLSREGHAREMKVVPWFEYGLMEPHDAEVVKHHPDWVLTRANGDPVMKMHGNHKRVWLNPAHPEVRTRFIGLVIEVIKRCQMDGLQLDDHFAWPVELGYDPYTVALYKQETGASPPLDYSNRFWMKWRRRQLTALLRELRQALVKEKLPVHISLAPGPFRFAYNNWLQDWELWTVGKLIDELVVQNYAYSLRGFAKDLDQPALRKARQWGLPVHIGVLAGFGKRTTQMPVLVEKVRMAAERGHGVIYFYWEGLWGQHAGEEGEVQRLMQFKQLHGNKN